MSFKHFYRPILLACLITMCSCEGPAPPSGEEMIVLEQKPDIFPDYTDITIPPNIAPLNFQVLEEGEAFLALIEGPKGKAIRLRSKNSTFRIPSSRWSQLLSTNQGSHISVRVFKKDNKQWSGFAAFRM